MGKTAREDDQMNVIIAGGGVAALETMMALRGLAGERVAITLLAPQDEFVYRPMTVREPFAYAPAERYRIAEIAADFDAKLDNDAFGWVEPNQRTIGTEQDRKLGYDALVLALGARPYERFEHALTIDDRRLDETVHGLVQDVEGGYSRRIAFVVPERMGWPLPIYELALMLSRRAFEMCVDVELTIVTPEDSPLAIFGLGASAGAAELLEKAGIKMITSAYAEVHDSKTVTINPGDRSLEVDRIVALPLLMGPAVRGLPAAEHGFIPAAPDMQVRDVERVYAAGDAIDFAIKHGGLASQQADVVAASIARLAGAPVELETFKPVIRGMLLTGNGPLYLTAQITGGAGFSSELSETCPWSPPAKIAAKYLAPYLDRRDSASSAASKAAGVP